MALLAEFSDEVVAFHALIAAEIRAGERPSNDTLRELAAEALSIDRLAVMSSREVTTIQLARDTWQTAFNCFASCLDLWTRLPDDDGQLTGHRRLLARLLNNADDRRQFYTVSEADRREYNAARDHEVPLHTEA
jgi:hypothetical protein